ncbi:MAG: hypothetical protein Q9187_000013 [Circinaria calcarea]
MSSSKTIQQPPLVRFYDPSIAEADVRGRTLDSILAWSDEKLEAIHNYIQTLFPLPEKSEYASAPIIDKATFEAFRSRPELQARLRNAFVRVLRFYGFVLTDKHGQLDVVPGRNPSPAYKNWVRNFNHNHLRITRIIRSLRILGLEEEAKAFFAALTDVYEQQYPGRIGPRSMMYWKRAAERPLSLAPAHDKDNGQGADFLYEFEKGQEESDGTGDGYESDEDTSGNKD